MVDESKSLTKRFTDHWQHGALNRAYAEMQSESPDLGVIVNSILDEFGQLSDLLGALVEAVESSSSTTPE